MFLNFSVLFCKYNTITIYNTALLATRSSADAEKQRVSNAYYVTVRQNTTALSALHIYG